MTRTNIQSEQIQDFEEKRVLKSVGQHPKADDYFVREGCDFQGKRFEKFREEVLEIMRKGSVPGS